MLLRIGLLLSGCNDDSLFLQLLWVHLMVVSWSNGKSVFPLIILKMWQSTAVFLLVNGVYKSPVLQSSL